MKKMTPRKTQHQTCREEVGQHEDLVKHLCSKVQWREAAKRHPNIDFKQLARQGTDKVRQMIENRIKRLQYKGEPFKIGVPATNEEISVLKKELHIFFPDDCLDFEKVSKPGMLKYPKFKEFYTTHVRETQYSFQVKKCSDVNCQFHGWLKLDAEEFATVKWLPSPEVSATNVGKYKSFDETYGTEPHNNDRPGQTRSTSSSIAKAEFQLQPSRARMIVSCSECHFPRILYSKNKLSKDQLIVLEDYFEDQPFFCGHDIALESIPQKIYQHPKSICYTSLSNQYYQCTQVRGYKMVCCLCLDEDVVDANAKQPRCDKCMK